MLRRMCAVHIAQPNNNADMNRAHVKPKTSSEHITTFSLIIKYFFVKLKCYYRYSKVN